MAGVLDGVDRRTQLAGHNRLELLTFNLGKKQHYGINVFKVQEVIQCPPLTAVPHAHPVVRGIANMRGKTITVMDLSMAIGLTPLRDIENSYVIITEYNRVTQGFLVQGVERIVNLNWDAIKPPPRGVGSNYMTAVTEVDGQLVEIIDVEKVMAEVTPSSDIVSEALLEEGRDEVGQDQHHILVADDSSVARNQVKRTLDQMGVKCTLANNGREALDILKSFADEGVNVADLFSVVISDVEMPDMDGYTLTTEIRADPRLSSLYIILHTSLSGVFNSALVEKVGANEFIAKFKPDELASAVLKQLKVVEAQKTSQ